MSQLSGDIELMPLTDVVAWLGNNQCTVTLTINAGQTTTQFVLRKGHLVQAASSDPREYLGQHLINFGYIGEEQLARAFQTQQETAVPLGRVLVMVSALTAEQLSRVLVFKSRESLLERLCLDSGSFVVSSDVLTDTDLDLDPAVNVLEVHSEAIARRHMWQEMRRIFPSGATRCDVLAVPPDLPPFDTRLLELLKSGCSIGEASLELRAMDFQSYARLYDLHNRGVIRPRLIGIAHPVEGEEASDASDTFELSEVDIVEQSLDSTSKASSHATRQATPQATSQATSQQSADPAVLGVALDDAGIRRARTGEYAVIRPAPQAEAPGVSIPADALHPVEALRVALAGRAYQEVLLLADRLIEQDPHSLEAKAARQVAQQQLQQRGQTGGQTPETMLARVPHLATPRAQVAMAHMSSKERYVLSRIDGKRSLQQIAQVSPIGRDELLRIVEAFVSRGTVALQ